MFAAIPSWLESSGQAAAALAAVLGLLAMVRKSRPVQWVWRRLVSGPITEWLRHNTEEVVSPVKDALVSHMVDELAQRQADAEENRAWRANVEAQLADGSRRFDALDAKLDRALAAVREAGA